jgi:hypothetical protein
VRKWVWGIRVGFLAVAAVLLVGAVQMRREYEGEARSLHEISGLTSQNERVRLQLDEADQLWEVSTTLTPYCSWGDDRPVRWRLSRTASGFSKHGEELRVHSPGEVTLGNGHRERAHFTLHARVAGDELDGVIRVFSRFGRDGERRWVCDTGPVLFAAGEDAGHRLVKAMGLAR